MRVQRMTAPFSLPSFSSQSASSSKQKGFAGSQPVGHGGMGASLVRGRGGQKGSASRSLDTSASALLAVPESTIIQPRRQSR
jgi:hypothetical protein